MTPHEPGEYWATRIGGWLDGRSSHIPRLVLVRRVGLYLRAHDDNGMGDFMWRYKFLEAGEP